MHYFLKYLKCGKKARKLLTISHKSYFSFKKGGYMKNKIVYQSKQISFLSVSLTFFHIYWTFIGLLFVLISCALIIFMYSVSFLAHTVVFILCAVYKLYNEWCILHDEASHFKRIHFIFNICIIKAFYTCNEFLNFVNSIYLFMCYIYCYKYFIACDVFIFMRMLKICPNNESTFNY